MRHPKIIEGAPFDWADAKKYADNVIDKDGEVNWRNAFFADPGVTKCPKCEEYYWNEGQRVECLDCGTQWDTTNKRAHRSPTVCAERNSVPAMATAIDELLDEIERLWAALAAVSGNTCGPYNMPCSCTRIARAALEEK